MVFTAVLTIGMATITPISKPAASTERIAQCKRRCREEGATAVGVEPGEGSGCAAPSAVGVRGAGAGEEAALFEFIPLHDIGGRHSRDTDHGENVTSTNKMLYFARRGMTHLPSPPNPLSPGERGSKSSP